VAPPPPYAPSKSSSWSAFALNPNGFGWNDSPGSIIIDTFAPALLLFYISSLSIAAVPPLLSPEFYE